MRLLAIKHQYCRFCFLTSFLIFVEFPLIIIGCQFFPAIGNYIDVVVSSHFQFRSYLEMDISDSCGVWGDTLGNAILPIISYINDPYWTRLLVVLACEGYMCLQEHIDFDVVKSTNPEFKKATVRINIYKQHRQTIQVDRFSDLFFCPFVCRTCLFHCWGKFEFW